MGKDQENIEELDCNLEVQSLLQTLLVLISARPSLLTYPSFTRAWPRGGEFSCQGRRRCQPPSLEHTLKFCHYTSRNYI